MLWLWMTWGQFTLLLKKGSHLELVKYLVKKGASLSAKNKAGKTLLDFASSDEIRSFFLECESASKQGDKTGKLNAQEPQSKAVSGESRGF